MAVNMHRHIQLIGIGCDSAHSLITHCIGRMGRTGNFNQAIALVGIPQLQALVYIVVWILAASGGEVEYCKANLTAHAAALNLLGHGVGKKVHIGKAGGACLDHFRHGQIGAVGDKFCAQYSSLHRPDMFFQPGLQWQVIGVTTQ